MRVLVPVSTSERTLCALQKAQVGKGVLKSVTGLIFPTMVKHF